MIRASTTSWQLTRTNQHTLRHDTPLPATAPFRAFAFVDLTLHSSGLVCISSCTCFDPCNHRPAPSLYPIVLLTLAGCGHSAQCIFSFCAGKDAEPQVRSAPRMRRRGRLVCDPPASPRLPSQRRRVSMGPRTRVGDQESGVTSGDGAGPWRRVRDGRMRLARPSPNPQQPGPCKAWTRTAC